MTAEPARSPVLEVRLAEEHGVPVYQQLAEQIRLLALGGQLADGTRLPAARNLAANLGINRNTVLKAYLVLAREGIVVGRRGGGTVVRAGQAGDEPDGGPPRQVVRRVQELLQLAAELNVSPARLVAYVDGQARLRATRSDLRVGFVECNPDSLAYFVSRLTDVFGVEVVPILLQELVDAPGPGVLGKLDCVVSTFFHLSEVRRSLREAGIDLELFAIGVRPHLSVLEALHRLPRRSVLGVAYYMKPGDTFARERLERMTEAVRQSAVRGVAVTPVLLLAAPEAGELSHMDAIVIRPENIAPIRAALPGAVPVIEFVNDLDEASEAYLREVFEDLASRHGGRRRGGSGGSAGDS